MAKISSWFFENGNPKNIHGFWSQVHKQIFGTLRQMRLHSVDARHSVADRIGMAEEIIFTLEIYQAKFLMTVQKKWSKIVE